MRRIQRDLKLVEKTPITPVGNLLEARCPICQTPIRLFYSQEALKGKLLHHIQVFHKQGQENNNV